MGAQSMRYISTARDDSTDSQLDSGSPCYGDSKEGLHLRYSRVIFTLKEKLQKPMLLIKDNPCEKYSLYRLILL